MMDWSPPPPLACSLTPIHAPTPFDGDGHAFRLASEALWIRLAHLFDPYVAANASHIEPLPHQLTSGSTARCSAGSRSGSCGPTIPAADKTVMGGLLTKELLVRGSLARCPIIAPGSLVGQWQGKLLDKFDLAFEIMSRAHPVKSNGTVLVQRVKLDRFTSSTA